MTAGIVTYPVPTSGLDSAATPAAVSPPSMYSMGPSPVYRHALPVPPSPVQLSPGCERPFSAGRYPAAAAIAQVPASVSVPVQQPTLKTEYQAISPTPPSFTTDVGMNFGHLQARSLNATGVGSVASTTTSYCGLAAANNPSPCLLPLVLPAQSGLSPASVLTAATAATPVASAAAIRGHMRDSCTSASSSCGQISSAGSASHQFHASPAPTQSVFNSWPTDASCKEEATSPRAQPVMSSLQRPVMQGYSLPITYGTESTVSDVFANQSPTSQTCYDVPDHSSPASASSSSPPQCISANSPLPPAPTLGGQDVVAFGTSSAFTPLLG